MGVTDHLLAVRCHGWQKCHEYVTNMWHVLSRKWTEQCVSYHSNYPLAKLVNDIFNNSAETRIIPEDWKSFNVTAIHKKRNRQEPGNNRSISLISAVCKTMERLIKGKIITLLEGNNLIGDCRCLTSLETIAAA